MPKEDESRLIEVQDRSPLQAIIDEAQTEVELSVRPPSTLYKVTEKLSVAAVALSTVPLYGIYAYKYATTNVVLPSWVPLSARSSVIMLFPLSSVTVNVGQNTFGMIETYAGLAKIYNSQQSKGIKIAIAAGAAVLCIFPSLPPIAAAFLMKGEYDLFLKWLTRIATPICTIPFNYYSSLILIQDSVPRIFSVIKNIFNSPSTRWQENYILKDIYLGMLRDAIKNLSLNSKGAKNKFENQNLSEMLNGVMTLENFQKNIEKPHTFYKKVLTFFGSPKESAKKTAKLIGHFPVIPIAGSWLAYQCVTQQFWQQNIEKYFPNQTPSPETEGWIASQLSMVPLYYSALKLSYYGISGVFEVVSVLFKRFISEDSSIELPYCLKHYPKATMALSITVLALSALTYATSIELIKENCPEMIQDVAKILTYSGTPAFNGMICLTLINSVMQRFTMHRYPDDDIAGKIISFLQKIIVKVEKMPIKEFAESVVRQKMQLFVQSAVEGLQPYPQLQELLEGSKLELELDRHYERSNSEDTQNNANISNALRTTVPIS